MPLFLISFDDGWMQFTEEDLPELVRDTVAVEEEAKAAGVWVFGAGFERQRAAIVSTDGTITDGPFPETKDVIGGFAIVQVASRDEALTWAKKLAKACRCKQEVREIVAEAPL